MSIQINPKATSISELSNQKRNNPKYKKSILTSESSSVSNETTIPNEFNSHFLKIQGNLKKHQNHLTFLQVLKKENDSSSTESFQDFLQRGKIDFKIKDLNLNPFKNTSDKKAIAKSLLSLIKQENTLIRQNEVEEQNLISHYSIASENGSGLLQQINNLFKGQNPNTNINATSVLRLLES